MPKRQSDGNLRPRATTGGHYSAGDWRRRGVQTGTGATPASARRWAKALTGMGLPIAITCFVLAAAVRIIQGSRPWRV